MSGGSDRPMLRRTLVAVALLFFVQAHGGEAQSRLPVPFTTEQQAQQHCPNDIVVWLNLPSGIYHFKGERWYGRTKNGAYICKQEADKVGDRGSLNGQ